MLALAVLGALSCSSSPTTSRPPDTGPALEPGEICDTTNTSPLNVRFDPPVVYIAPNQVRPVNVIVEPDLCSPATLTLSSSTPGVAIAPPPGALDLRHPTYEFEITGAASGTTTLTASVATAILGGSLAAAPTCTSSTSCAPNNTCVIPANTTSGVCEATLPVTVMSGTPPSCAPSDVASGMVSGSQTTLNGTGGLAAAQIGVPPGAFARTDWLAIPPFPATITCDPTDLTASAPGGLVKIGPAVTFAGGAPLPQNQSLRRELNFSIPVNPAAIPQAGRMRHLVVLYRGPMAQEPRPITIASPSIQEVGTSGQFVLSFASPWFGTFQAAFPPDAGTEHRTRHLTHRAVVGFSMGAGGAASFGLRHHDQFDLIAPMGGPSDWTWLAWFIEHYILGGFCPATEPNCPTYPPDGYPIAETYVHTEDWNHFWYETGGGNGGTFSRQEYVQIFADLALMRGDPNGQNQGLALSPPDLSLSFFPAGPTATSPFVAGMASNLPPGVDCRVTLAPISTDPNYQLEQQWQSQCVASRCAASSTWVAPSGYFDATYNPLGAYPVISFCDGNNMGTSPYVDTWVAPTAATQFPVDNAFAVDLNGNGVRDMNEPVVRQGHEPWQDTGIDGLFDPQEPGYDPVLNPDPDQDDYDFQLNPNGTENNHRYDSGEPFSDTGVDGVLGTPQIGAGGYDYGEGDGQFTMSSGLLNFYAVDAHSILHQWTTNLPAGPMTDEALLNFDIWSDGGVRDLFNFAADANHLMGSIASRKGANGLPLRSSVFYNGFATIPGEDPTQPDNFTPDNVIWADIPDAPSVRYGTIDATPAQIAQGDGQHVGTAAQLLYRLTSSLYWGAQHWPDADRTLTNLTRVDPETTTQNVLGTNCEIEGTCSFEFTGPVTGRTGPIVVQLPPGYALAENAARDVRYPVVYVLHGYGQQPSDLEAVAIVSTNFMNDEGHSSATRLAKFILVYVDGRCRLSADGWPECIQGTFYLDSIRSTGAHIDSWFDELVAYVDQNYRTMPPSDVDWVE